MWVKGIRVNGAVFWKRTQIKIGLKVESRRLGKIVF